MLEKIINTITNGLTDVFTSQINYAYCVVFIMVVMAIRSTIVIKKHKTSITLGIGTLIAIIYAYFTESDMTKLFISIPFSMVSVKLLNINKWITNIYDSANIQLFVGGTNPEKDDDQGAI